MIGLLRTANVIFSVVSASYFLFLLCPNCGIVSYQESSSVFIFYLLHNVIISDDLALEAKKPNSVRFEPKTF